MFAQVRAPTEDRTSITMHPLLDEHGNEIGQVPIGNNIGQVGGNLVKVVMINIFFCGYAGQDWWGDIKERD